MSQTPTGERLNNGGKWTAAKREKWTAGEAWEVDSREAAEEFCPRRKPWVASRSNEP
jgi:hypothetical protein